MGPGTLRARTLEKCGAAQGIRARAEGFATIAGVAAGTGTPTVLAHAPNPGCSPRARVSGNAEAERAHGCWLRDGLKRGELPSQGISQGLGLPVGSEPWPCGLAPAVRTAVLAYQSAALDVPRGQ